MQNTIKVKEDKYMNNKRPNIILIMSDDLGYEVINANGGTSYETPRLNNLAETGIRFENAHAQPLCTPTRIQLMTGKYNFRNYIGFGLMDPNEKTFGHIMSDNGYKTLISGKWQLYSYNPPDEMPEERNKGQKIEDAGFDEFCVWHAHQTEEKGSRYKNPIVYQNGEYLSKEITEGNYGEDIFSDYILDFMERNLDDPFFVYFPMTLTHRPLEPTPDSQEFAVFDPPSNKTLGGRTWEQLEGWDDDSKYYKDMVEYHDKTIGKIVDKLDSLGIRENTLILYLGDNGSPIEVSSFMGDLEIPGGKGKTIDTGTHVPLICNWKSKIPASLVSTNLVDTTDFLPTIFEATGIKFPENYIIDGKSFYPQLLGEDGDPRDWIFFHFDAGGRNKRPIQRFLRNHSWKLYEDGRMFDMKSDLNEKNAYLPENDSDESKENRNILEPIFGELK
tara:strand:- start:3582 stop:4916 length:1335 start_codon:yes stop_codon:yes gene_type:complete